jgi:WD40 repeat protein
MAWSPDGKQIALGGGEQTIDIYNSESGDLLERRTGHAFPNIRQIKWPIGGKLSSMAYQVTPPKSELLIWDENRVASSKVIHTLQKPALGFVLDAKQEIALLFEESSEISLVAVPEGKLLKRVKLPDFSVAVAPHPSYPYFLVILDNREIWRVDHQGNTHKVPLRCPSPPSGAIIISPKGDKFAIGLNTSEFDNVSTSLVNIYNIESGELIAIYQGALSSFTKLENLPKLNSFIASQRTGSLVEISWQDGTLIKEYIKAPSGIKFSELSPGFNEICVIKGLGTVEMMNFPAMTNFRDFRNFETSPIRGLNWTKDSTRLVGWGWGDGTIRFWDGLTGQELLKFNAHEKQVFSVIELPGGRKFLSLGGDNQLKLWDATPIN